MKNHVIIPRTQRALVLQGGGALGAYEVGVLKSLCDKLTGDKESKRKEPLFDVIAGTSMGAINGAVLVSNVVNRGKTWQEAINELERFWTDDKDGLSSKLDYTKWWWNNGNIGNTVKSNEASRRYYSVKEYLMHGTPKVCTAPLAKGLDNKYGDQKDNLWFSHKIDPLERTVLSYSTDEKSSELEISTSWDKKQPRLLAVAVDVYGGRTVTFDSYFKKIEDPENLLYKGDGINLDHIMASGTLPEFYDFREIGGRHFCDGGLLSNTPFRELLEAHRDYWLGIIHKQKQKKDNQTQKIPDLEVYIVNVHPATRDTVLDNDDHDGVKDRINDIMFFDRNSHYDENAADISTDYVEVINTLRKLARRYTNKEQFDAFENHFQNWLTRAKAKSKSSRLGSRTFKDLLNGSFNLTRVVRIENTSYENSISGKIGDFTSQTVEHLITKGKDDAQKLVLEKA